MADEADIVARLHRAQAALEAAERERDKHRLLRDSWHDQWRRDAELRLEAERRWQEARALLGHARDLLVAWDACHDDRGLRRRTERLLEAIEQAVDEPGW